MDGGGLGGSQTTKDLGDHITIWNDLGYVSLCLFVCLLQCTRTLLSYNTWFWFSSFKLYSHLFSALLFPTSSATTATWAIAEAATASSFTPFLVGVLTIIIRGREWEPGMELPHSRDSKNNRNCCIVHCCIAMDVNATCYYILGIKKFLV